MAKRFLSTPWVSKQAVLIATLSFAPVFPVAAGIQGSVHDFSGSGWSGGEICNICHTPHNANIGTQSPLWNHEISTVSYQLYSSPTMNVVADQPLPGGLSRMCLSCHDGTVAIDSFGGTTGSTTITGNANLGTDLSNDHPVGIEWIHQTQSNGSLSCLECHALEFNQQTLAYEFVGTAGQELKFFDRKVECPSCHDVHNTQVMDVKLLRKPLAGSQLCLQCHPK